MGKSHQRELLTQYHWLPSPSSPCRCRQREPRCRQTRRRRGRRGCTRRSGGTSAGRPSSSFRCHWLPLVPLAPPEAECEDEQQDFPSEAAQLSLASELFLQPKYCDAGKDGGWTVTKDYLQSLQVKCILNTPQRKYGPTDWGSWWQFSLRHYWCRCNWSVNQIRWYECDRLGASWIPTWFFGRYSPKMKVIKN